MTGYERLVEALQRYGSRRYGDSWQCPAHEDRNPSLSVKEGRDGCGLLKCHAGCRTEDIVAALGLTMDDLRSDRDWKTEEPVAVYRYTDESGRPLFEVCRFSGKRFAQRLPDGRWGLNGARRVLYRLPQVLDAVKAGTTVYVVEGEKDVHSMERAGAVATTNPMGSGKGKWRPEYSETLKGARVVVVADADEPGRRHAREVEKSLRGIASSVEVVEPVEGKDPTDHLVAGHGLHDFRREAREGVVVTMASDIKPEKVRWLSEGRVPLDMLTLLVGDPGLGKSTVLLDVAARVTRGQLEGDLHGEPSNVLVATAEDSLTVTVVPRLIAAGADRNRVGVLEYQTREGRRGIIIPDDLPEIEKRLDEVRARLVILDPLVAHLPADVNSYRDQDIRRALDPLRRLAADKGCAVVAVVHLNKSQVAHLLNRIGGSVGIQATARSVLFLAPDPDDARGADGPMRVLAHGKSNIGPKAPTLRLRVDNREVEVEGETMTTSGLAWLGEAEGVLASSLLIPADPEERGKVQEAMEWLRESLAGGPRPQKEVLREWRATGMGSEKTLHRAKSAKTGLGVLSERRGFGRGAEWYWVLSEDSQGASIDGQSVRDDHLWTPPGETAQVNPIDGQSQKDDRLWPEGGQE